MAPAWAEAFLKSKSATHVRTYPGDAPNEYRVAGAVAQEQVHIDIRAHGSSTGFKELMDGTADIAMSSRGIKSAEVLDLAKLGDLSTAAGEHVVAIDGLAVIVHPSNPIAALDKRSLALAFAGKIRNWQQLGGRDQPVSLYARDEKSGTWDTFKTLVLGEQYQLSKSAERFESSDALSARVAADIGAIGFVGLASVNEARALAIFDGSTHALTPLPLNVATEDYLLSRRLYLYAPTAPSTLVQEFIQFCQSAPGQNLVQHVGFIAQTPKRLLMERVVGPTLYQNIAKHSERLTINFRFRKNSAELDNKAQRDVRRLADYLKQQENRALRVQLVGFSDEKHTGMLAQVLSRLRATAVKTELFRLGITTESVVGFGSSRPVAVDAEMKSKNDRVEVWVYTDKHDEAVEALKDGAKRFAHN